MTTPVYLDHAAATPLDGRVLAAMQPYFSEQFYNPSALYAAAGKVQHDIAAARSTVAQVLGCRPTELIFTAGGTEANNLAIHGVLRRYPGGRAVVSAIEHDSVLAAARQYEVVEVAPMPDGSIAVADLERRIDDATVLVSVMYANNEIGTVQPIRRISRLIADMRRDRQDRGVGLPLYLHCDAAQAGNYLDVHVSRLGIDLLSLNGGKLYGPKQSGALYVRAGTDIVPLLYGGGQERGLRSGTENVPGVVGFSAALLMAQQLRTSETERLVRLRQRFLDGILEIRPDAHPNGSLRQRLPNNVHVTIPGIDNERLVLQLDETGVQAAVGSACSASSDEPSHVLQAIGLDDAAARSSLRFTMGRQTDEDSVAYVLRQLRRLLV